MTSAASTFEDLSRTARWRVLLGNVTDQEEADYFEELVSRLVKAGPSLADALSYFAPALVLGSFALVMEFRAGDEVKSLLVGQGAMRVEDGVVEPPEEEPTPLRTAPQYERFLRAKEQLEEALALRDSARVLLLLDDEALLPAKIEAVRFAGWRAERLIELRRRAWQALFDSPDVLDYRRVARAFEEEPKEVARDFHEPLVERASLRELAIATYQEIHALGYRPGDPAPRMSKGWSRLEEGYAEREVILHWSRRRVVEGYRLDLSGVGRADWKAYAQRCVDSYLADPAMSDGMLRLVDAHSRPPAMDEHEAQVDHEAKLAYFLGGDAEERDGRGFELTLELAERALDRRKIRALVGGRVVVLDERDGVADFDERYRALVAADGRP